MIAIGYQDTYDVLPESLVKKVSMPRERKSLSEIVFLEELNKSLVLKSLSMSKCYTVSL